MAHPHRGVQAAASLTLRYFCLAVPRQLSFIITNSLTLLQRDLNVLAGPGGFSLPNQGLPRQCYGRAQCIAACISAVPNCRLYISYETLAKVFLTAWQLMKATDVPGLAGTFSAAQNVFSNKKNDPKINLIFTHVAWSLIGSLMCLGSNFVKIHLAQLLLLWKACLGKSKPSGASSTADSAADTAQLSPTDWQYFLEKREAALTALLSLLVHSSAPSETDSRNDDQSGHQARSICLRMISPNKSVRCWEIRWYC